MTVTDADLLSEAQLKSHYAWAPGSSLRLNIVINSSGALTGEDATSESLTNVLDRRILRILREETDAVIMGASSVRAEGWYLPPRGTLVVLSASGNLPWDSCPDRDRVLVVSSAEGLREWIEAHPGKLLCEGGLETATALATFPGFDEMAVSVQGSDIAAANTIVGSNAQLLQMNFQAYSAHENMTFCLWRRAA